MLFGKLVQYKCFNSQISIRFITSFTSRKFRFRKLLLLNKSSSSSSSSSTSFHHQQHQKFINSLILLQKIYINHLKTLFYRLYSQFISFKSLKNNKLLNAKSGSGCFAATAGIFSWDDWKITNEDIKNEIDDMLNTFKKNTQDKENENEYEGIKINFEYSRTIERDNEWKKVYDKKDLIIWRRKLLINSDNTLAIPVQEDNDNSSSSSSSSSSPSSSTTTDNKNANASEDMHEIFEYKVLGRLNDVTPLEFFHTQVDLDFRKEWDYLVISIESLYREETTNTEVIKWLMKFPYPLYPREYVFVRRCCLEPKQKVLVVVSKSLPDIKLLPSESSSSNCKKEFIKHNQSHQADHSHPQHPQPGNVRVTSYKSNMIILPHKELNEKGLDYVIQYYDDSKARIPKLAYKWVTASGLPDYTEKLHKATLRARSKVSNEATNIFRCCDKSQQNSK